MTGHDCAAIPSLDDLHRRYDGPVPPELLAEVRAGGPEALRRLRLGSRLSVLQGSINRLRAAVAALRARYGPFDAGLEARVRSIAAQRAEAVSWIDAQVDAAR